jgi:hypothetical protein
MLKPALAAMLEKLSAEVKWLVSVTDLDELVVPTVTVPKLNVVAESVTGALPVPVRFTVCGLFPALSVNVRVPVAAPTTAGVNVTPTVQVAPAATLVPHVLLAMAKGEAVAMLLKLNAPFK